MTTMSGTHKSSICFCLPQTNGAFRRAFRVYTREDLLDTRIVPLSEIPSSIFWGQQDRFRDTLYHGTQPFIFYIPTSVAHIMFEEAIGGQHSFVLQLSPIALQDILALDILCQFINPTDCTFFVPCTNMPVLIHRFSHLPPINRSIMYISARYRRMTIFAQCPFTELTRIQVAIPDIAYGTSMQTVRWSDIAVNDYILAELSINRVFGVNGMWAMNYRLLGATRIATLA